MSSATHPELQCVEALQDADVLCDLYRDALTLGHLNQGYGGPCRYCGTPTKEWASTPCTILIGRQVGS